MSADAPFGFFAGGCLLVEEDLFNSVTAPERSATPMPRAMLVFAHPDDEVLALGGRLKRFRDAHMVHVTDGAPGRRDDPDRERYARTRRWELEQALEEAGVSGMSRECLGMVDQTASLHLGALTWAINRRLERLRPQVVFTHPYEGGHPDHDACAFAVQYAVRRFRQSGGAVLCVEAPFYHLGPDGIVTGEFLPDSGGGVQRTYSLDATEREQKEKLLTCFRSQQEMLRQFRTDSESYRTAPDYDFTRPPHQPPVFYDRFAWGMHSERFCELAAEAQAMLAVQENALCH